MSLVKIAGTYQTKSCQKLHFFPVSIKVYGNIFITSVIKLIRVICLTLLSCPVIEQMFRNSPLKHRRPQATQADHQTRFVTFPSTREFEYGSALKLLVSCVSKNCLLKRWMKRQTLRNMRRISQSRPVHCSGSRAT